MATVPRWAVWAAYAVPLCVLLSAVWRTGEAFTQEVGLVSGGWYLLLLTGLSMGAALLTLGLVHRWGERIPRWVPLVGGRNIPVRAAVIPALAGGVLVIVICLYWVLNTLFGFVERGVILIGDDNGLPTPGPSVMALYIPWLAWGPLVVALALAYRRRRNSSAMPRVVSGGAG
ncbi:hypothetical protein KIPE111705_03195 [Kibdelosporangium persicum]|uniref:DUF3995 domain-containing protein n=1 Tax=Kibdelosporangium persicum TaxID=2698649 RepID=A0ABX2F7V5_9PSEU|nr:hypothetical protein [Kibdelosporangium persicum]NRN67436.1 hypothetical protein [Kibdelosporangium persicum]